MEQKMNDQDVLLVKEKDESKLKAVGGFDNDGKLKTELPKQANAGGFLKIDRFGNPLESFFTNFQRQYQNPERKVPLRCCSLLLKTEDKSSINECAWWTKSL